MGIGKWATSSKKSQLIYHFIRNNGSVSKQDIVIGLKLSLPTITQNLQYLTDLRLVDTSLKIQNTGGRSATAYTYMPHARIAIGIYLTSNHINVVSVDLWGNIVEVEKAKMVFQLDDDTYLKKIGELVELVIQKTDVPEENLLGVGIAVQGLVTDDGEEVLYGSTLNFTGKTRAQIAKYIPYKNRLFHDSEVGGYAEVWVDEDLKDAFYISLCNSIGGAVILNNEIHPGDTNKCGDIGHLVMVASGGRQCYCGRYGCFETVCRATILADYAGGDLAEFFDLLDHNDEGAARIWKQYLADLALAIHNVRMLFNSTIILGGYVGAYIDKYMDDLCALVDERNPFSEIFNEKAEYYLRSCKYKVEAAAAGAAISYINQFFENI